MLFVATVARVRRRSGRVKDKVSRAVMLWRVGWHATCAIASWVLGAVCVPREVGPYHGAALVVVWRVAWMSVMEAGGWKGVLGIGVDSLVVVAGVAWGGNVWVETGFGRVVWIFFGGIVGGGIGMGWRVWWEGGRGGRKGLLPRAVD